MREKTAGVASAEVRRGRADLSRGVEAAESSRSARHRGDGRGSRKASGFPERGGQAGRAVPHGDCQELERATGSDFSEVSKTIEPGSSLGLSRLLPGGDFKVGVFRQRIIQRTVGGNEFDRDSDE